MDCGTMTASQRLSGLSSMFAAATDLLRLGCCRRWNKLLIWYVFDFWSFCLLCVLKFFSFFESLSGQMGTDWNPIRNELRGWPPMTTPVFHLCLFSCFQSVRVEPFTTDSFALLLMILITCNFLCNDLVSPCRLCCCLVLLFDGLQNHDRLPQVELSSRLNQCCH